MSSNWALLKKKIEATSEESKKRKIKRCDLAEAVCSEREAQKAKKKQKSSAVLVEDLSIDEKAKYVALDCEMVGIGPGGKRSALARCCVVDFDGNVLFDEHVRPPDRITDFRTKYSGVRAKDLKNAQTFQQCQKKVAELLKGKILVGHALKNDLDVLFLSHPPPMVRDTSRYRPFMKPLGKEGGRLRPNALKVLAQEHLGLEIQSGEHNPAEDAMVAMKLYQLKRKEWEKSLKLISKKHKKK